MNKLIKTILPILFIVFGTNVSAAVIELPFGGIRTATVPCTCSYSPAKALVTVYDFLQKRELLLSYIPVKSRIYREYNLWSSMFLLGSYNPYIRDMCLITVTGSDCEPIPDDGSLGALPGTGTSR